MAIFKNKIVSELQYFVFAFTPKEISVPISVPGLHQFQKNFQDIIKI